MKSQRMNLCSLILFMCFSLSATVCVSGSTQGNCLRAIDRQIFENWEKNIMESHPRLFFNKSTLEATKERAFGDEKESLKEMKLRIDTIIDKEIDWINPYEAGGAPNEDNQYGFLAAESALLYHLYGEKKYLDFSKNVLKAVVDYYHLRIDAGLNIHWYAFSQIGTLCAYDWIYNELAREEQVEIGQSLIRAIDGIVYDGVRKPFFRENTGDYASGFYGPPVLPWYAGLVFHKTGVDDLLAEKMLLKGYDDHIKLLKYRENMSGDIGGASTACMEYAFRFYPWAEFNFFHTFQSATNQDMASQWTYVRQILNYMDWNWLPQNREFGFGDVRHYSCELPTEDMNMHITQLIHFYGKDNSAFVERAERMKQKTKPRKVETMPFIRFFVSKPEPDIILNTSEDTSSASAMFFEKMGQVFMRSGVGDNDTYALFSSGGIFTQHKHFDNNNFVIYKNGYRALDSGTRPQPGLHLSHYFARTVAHNCILIEMPGEEMPDYWGGAALSENKNEPVPNDGGQCKVLGSKVLSFKNNNEFVYLASDATESYHKDKASQVLREFVYILPDVFIVLDRVVSTDSTYQKKWLLHTVAEPELLNQQEFSEESEGGKLICRTLLPEQPALNKIGGPGKQFWSGGKNWTLPILTPEDWNYALRHWTPDDTHPQLGQWRVEIMPTQDQTQDYFLHIIQVGDHSLQSLPDTQLIKNEKSIELGFEYNGKSYQVIFDLEQSHGGHMSISEKGKQILTTNLGE